MNVLFTIAGLHPASGGPARSVPALCAALDLDGVPVELVSHHYGTSAGEPMVPTGQNIRMTFVDCDSLLTRRLQWTPRFRRVLRSRCEAFRPQLLHDTGIWLSTNHAAATIAGELNIRRIVSPRGMLSDWALRHRGWKKRIAWVLYQHEDLATTDVLHATSHAEAQEFRAIGLRQPVAMIPNGVELPPLLTSGLRPPASDLRTLLFLSRIHPKKGLLELVKAWASVRPAGWRVVVAGTDEDNHEAEIKRASRELGVAKDFSFPGAVTGDAKWNLYHAADLFVLPSHSENFGIVVAEALACGVPVITSHGTPWEDLIKHRCGWWCANGAESLTAALREATQCSVEVRRAMGIRGRRLVEEKFSWPGIATQMLSVYQWMIGTGAKPPCVID